MRIAPVGLAVLSVIAVSLSGCSGSPDAPPAGGESTSPSDAMDPNGRNGTNNMPPEPRSFDVYLTSDYGLSVDPQTAGSAMVTEGFLNPAFAAGQDDITP